MTDRDINAERSTVSLRWLISTIAALLHRPDLWGTAARQLFRLAEPGWWRSWPPLPLPAPDYLDFRMVTMYGSEAAPVAADVVTYLEWCRSWHGSITRARRP